MTVSWKKRLKKDWSLNWTAYLMVLPILLYYAIFHYKPMYGIVISFKDFSIRKGIMGSEWVGLRYYIDFFGSYYFLRLLKNTVVISLTTIAVSFPAPIIFALLLNEVRSNAYKRTIQTVAYMPHFISLVVICALVGLFTAHDSLLTTFFSHFGYDPKYDMLNFPQYFVPIYVLSGVWQNTGWSCIIYLSALAGIDMELYEAARIDGANRWHQTLHITLPGIANTIILLFVLRLGSIMSVGYEKIILLYNEGTYVTADVISTYTYRRGLVQGDYAYSTAIGLFNSVINIIFVLSANKASNKLAGTGLF